MKRCDVGRGCLVFALAFVFSAVVMFSWLYFLNWFIKGIHATFPLMR
jgi:hypothetical protein